LQGSNSSNGGAVVSMMFFYKVRVAGDCDPYKITLWLQLILNAKLLQSIAINF